MGGKIVVGNNQTYHIKNAGLVLLHLLLETLFGKVGFLNNGILNSGNQAANVLQLAVGDLNTPHLLLNNILCGLEHDTVGLSDTVFDKQEIDAVEEILTIALLRWKEMQNTSLKGFQESFICREGMLIKTGEDWTLKVEQRSFDVLLQTLPWSIGSIKLPWMNTVLQVDWV